MDKHRTIRTHDELTGNRIQNNNWINQTVQNVVIRTIEHDTKCTTQGLEFSSLPLTKDHDPQVKNAKTKKSVNEHKRKMKNLIQFVEVS